MAKKKKGFGGLLTVAALAGVVAAIFKLEKEAKEKDTDILDVAKEKVDGFVNDVKTGEIQEKADAAVDKVADFATKTVEDVKSGEFTKNVSEQFNKTVEEIKSGEALDKVEKFATGVKEGVVDIFDGKKAEEDSTEEPEEKTEA